MFGDRSLRIEPSPSNGYETATMPFGPPARFFATEYGRTRATIANGIMNLSRLIALGSLVSIAQATEFASRLGRTIILARLLSPAEFGIGAALTLLMGIAELSTDLALDRFLILRAGRDDGDVLAAAHRLSVMRGAVLAIVIFVAAPWIAQFLGAPDHVWSFRAVAGIILLHSGTHFEMKQIQQDFRYAPDALAYIITHVTVFMAVYPAARLLGDHRAVLVLLAIEAVIFVAVSHLVARRPYTLACRNPGLLRAALAYGLPLSLNGIGLAAMGQLDRAVVSHWFGVESLAFYTVILNFTVIPISAIQRILGQLGMSFLARAHSDRIATMRVALALAWAYALAAGFYALFIAATLNVLAPLLFGALYTVSPLFHGLVVLVVWTRLCRGAPTLLLLSSGATRRLMLSNLVAAIWLVFVVALLPLLPRLETVLACVLIGDVIASTVFILQIRQNVGGRLTPVLGDVAWSLLAVCVACLGIAEPYATASFAKLSFFAVALSMLGLQATYGGWRHVLRDRNRTVPG